MKKAILTTLILTLLDLFFFSIPTYYFIKVSTGENIEKAISFISDKTNHTVEVFKQCDKSIDILDLGYYQSGMYFIKGFENIDSLKFLISEGQYSFLMDKVNLVLGDKLGWSGHEIVDNGKSKYLFCYSSDNESEIEVISIVNLESFTYNTNYQLRMLFIMSIVSLIIVFSVNLHFIKRIKRKQN